ncbi:FkbM family methyltransferase [Bradyrhizobium sp. AUGA SZCCT0431]|uniref:FkbM family methyltransferase n=1 Tax=Bradyrhizobium sp. AUGA SZCCT0431 TaxID=2807674 RepID=UPI001BA5A74A|nr:FkbM family methyltransferase [Bradyrhizobium sp. AUGA SZCCT0431]MBR1142359.1 FkbM family methyltransferase [Bradyrhizobium sp. AUGA SZCCT0431]
MKTANKIALARSMYRVVHLGRALVGRSDQCIVNRGGATFELELSQAIDFTIYLGNVFELGTKGALRRLVVPSSTVLDIGANIGAHTLHLAGLVGPAGRVLAFEPTQFAFRKLRRNIDLNPALAGRISTYHCFLGAQDGNTLPDAIYSSWPLMPEGELHEKHLGRAMATETATTRSIDSVLAEAGNPVVQLVKLDVDGFECEILRGATALLRDQRPIFVMELAPYVLVERGASLEEMLSFLIPNGYRLYDERTERAMPSTASELQKLIADGESINVIARVN